MGQVHHGSAAATAAVRRAIQHGQESLGVLAKRHGIQVTTPGAGSSAVPLLVEASPSRRRR